MRFTVVALVATGLAAAAAPAVEAAVALDLAAPASARCAPSDAACLAPAATPIAATFTRADAMPVAQPVARGDAGAVPPAAVAAIVGLLALAMAIRPRSRGLPEVTS